MTGETLRMERKTIVPNFKNYKHIKYMIRGTEKLYTREFKIGQGAFSQVYRVRCKKTFKEYAMKIMTKD